MRLRNALLSLLALGYPLLLYFGLQHWSPRAMALVLLALAAARACAGGGRTWWWLAGATALPALGGLVSGDALPLKLYPVLVNAAMLAVFGWSLRGPQCLVERLARLQEPDLPPAGVRYTRRVTWAWCLFFIGNGTLAALTACLTSDRVWALYNGCIAYGLIGAMFAGEWLLRQRMKARARHA